MSPNPTLSLDAASRRQWITALIILAILWGLPFSIGGFAFYLGTIVAIYATSALGLQLMVGLGGQLSLGHAAFLGIGAYATALLELRAGFSYIAASACGAAIGGIFGLLMAQLIRLSGVYFKIATFGFGIIAYQLMHNLAAITGGHGGLTGIPPLDVLGVNFDDPSRLYAIAAMMVTITYVLFLRLVNSRAGRAFSAIGQNEIAARSIGVPVEAYKMAVIVIGCTVAAWAGSLVPHLYQYVSPDYFGWHESLVLLIIITVGGHGSMAGAVLGAAILIVIPEYMRDLAEYKMLMYGVLLVAFMMLLPKGVAGVGYSLLSWMDHQHRRQRLEAR
ncbi:branched-chain amino acid ABC transporter permease [Bradyrhizobium sp. DASA03007]|uniref:branched-chain amino acid ABC transporter permease n=1 Tax=unclassified Bradyrhizobium TaxID=2631580 RepID=UPI003F71081F